MLLCLSPQTLSQALICRLTLPLMFKLLEQYFVVDAVKTTGYIRV